MARTVRFHEYGGPEVLRVDDVPVRPPGAGELLIRIEAIGVNRAEALFRSGRYIEEVRRFPAGLGAEASGVVAETGPGVPDFAPGDAVSVLPGFSQNDYPVYAEAAVVPAAAVLHRPAELDAIGGAALWMPYLTAYGALVQVGGVRAGDHVLLNAASSSVGLAAIAVLNRVGAVPIALTGSAAKREALRAAGAAEVLTGSDDVAARVRQLTGGRGVEIVFDAVAGPGVRDLAALVAPDGLHLLYGALSGEPTPFPGFDLGMPAVALRTFTVHEITRDPERLRRAVAFVRAGLRDGALRPAVDRTLALADAAAAHRYLESGDRIGKIVLTV